MLLESLCLSEEGAANPGQHYTKGEVNSRVQCVLADDQPILRREDDSAETLDIFITFLDYFFLA